MKAVKAGTVRRGLRRSTYWHNLHIDGKGEDDDSNGVSSGKSSARTVTSSSHDFSTLDFLTLEEQLVDNINITQC